MSVGIVAWNKYVYGDKGSVRHAVTYGEHTTWCNMIVYPAKLRKAVRVEDQELPMCKACLRTLTSRLSGSGLDVGS